MALRWKFCDDCFSMQVSRTPHATFEFRAALPGVGEAPRHEIAGLGLGGSAGSMGIWRCECSGSDGFWQVRGGW